MPKGLDYKCSSYLEINIVIMLLAKKILANQRLSIHQPLDKDTNYNFIPQFIKSTLYLIHKAKKIKKVKNC